MQSGPMSEAAHRRAFDQMDPKACPLLGFRRIFYDRIQTIAKICAIDIVDPNFEKWFGTILFVASMALALVCSFYTIGTYEMDWKLKTITMLGTNIQGMVKYVTVVSCSKDIYRGLSDLREMYEVNSDTAATQRSTILLKWSARFVWLLNAFYCLMFVTVSSFMMYPLLVYFVTGERENILPIFVPFVDEQTTMGYCVSSAIQTTWATQAGFGLAGSDSLLAMMVLHVLPMVELFELSFAEMDRALVRWPNDIGQTSATENWMRNLVRMHQELSSYMENIANVNATAIFCDVYSNGLTLCFITFCLTVQTWFPLYFLFLVTFVKLFVICFLGTVVETATDRILASIQSSNWYLLPLPLQRHVQIMTQKAQHPRLMMAGTVPLNLDTFVNVMKNVYSVAMILAEAVE